MRLRIEGNGNGLISYEITWLSGIRIDQMVDPEAPAWDEGLEGCVKRVHIATLDVLNSYLTQLPQIPAKAGIHWSVFQPGALVGSFVRRSLPLQGPAELIVVTFQNLPYLNTS